MAKQLNVNLAFTADTSKAKAQLQDLNKQLDNLIGGKGVKNIDFGITKEINEGIVAAAKLKAQLNDATDVNTGKLDLTKFSQSLKKSGMELKDYAKALQGLGPQGSEAFISLARSISTAEVPLIRVNKKLEEMWTTLKNTARWQISSSILHGFMGSVQSAFGYAEDLNESLNNIRIVTGQNVDQMSKFAKEANKAAKALSTTTTEYTNASLIYYQQGLSDQEVKERTDITIKMANVSRESAEVVSDQMTAVWNNFDNGSKSLEYYADVMTALGAATASSTAEISDGLEKFAAVAETVGLSYEYATASLATITATTRQSADVVGTALKTLFARIQGLNLGETLDDGTTLNKYSQALEKIGISIFEQNGNMKEMDVILNEMGTKWNTLSKDQQTALAQTVAGVRQYTQLIALMDNWDYFQENLGVASNAEGALQEQADIYAESWEAAEKRVRAAAEAIYSNLIDDEFFIDLLDFGADALNMIDKIMDSLGGLPGILSVISAILLKTFKGKIADEIGNITTGIKNVYSLTTTTKKDVQNQGEDKKRYKAKSLEKNEETGRERVKVQEIIKPEGEKPSKNKWNDLKAEGLKQAADLYQSDGTQEGEMKANHFAQEMQLQEQFLQKAHLLTEQEREQFQYQFDGLRIMQQKAEEQTKLVEKQKEALAIEERRLNLSAGKDTVKNYKKSITTMKDLDDIFAKVDGDLDDDASYTKEIREEFENKLREHYKTVTKDAAGKEIVKYNKLPEVDTNTYSDWIKEQWALIEEESNKTLEEAGPKFKQRLENFGKVYLNNLDMEDQAKNMANSANQYAEKMGGNIENISKKLATWKENAITAAGGLAQLTAGFTMAKTALESFDEAGKDGVYTLQELGGAAVSLGAGLTSAFNGLKELNTITVDNTGKTLGAALANTKLGGAFAKLGGGAGTSAGQLLALGGTVALVAAAIGVLAFAINEGVKAYNADATAAKEAAEAADNLRESSSKLRDEAEKLQSTFENYDSLLDNLKSAKEGTDEWREALEKVNNETLNILEKYPDLLKMENVLDETGRFNKDTIDEYIKTAENKADDARLASISASASASEKKVTSDTTNLSREIDDFVDEYLSTTAKYARKGEAATTAQAEKDLINNLIKSFNEQRDSGVITEGADEFNSIINDYTKSLGLSESEQTKLAEKLQSYRGDIVELANATKNATTQMENVAKLSAQQILGQSATEDQTDAWSQAYIGAKEDYTGGQGINRFTGKNSQVLLDLLKDAGITTGLSNNAVYDDNGVLKVRFEDGTEQTLYEIKELAATNYAREQANQEVVYNAPIFDQFKEKGIELNENISADLATSLMNQVEFNDTLVHAFQAVGDSAVEQEKLIKDILSSQTVQDKEAAEIQSIKSDAVSNYELDPEIIEEQAEQLMSLYKAQGLTEKEATKLAIENQRMNKGVESLVDNWEDWNKELQAGKLDKNKKGTAQYAKTINDLTKTIADLTGASANLELPDEFFDSEDNLKLIEQAANGSEQAINELGVAVGRAQVELMAFEGEFAQWYDNNNLLHTMSTATFETYKQQVLTGIDELAAKVADGSIKVGDKVNAMGSDWVNALNQMALATNMSVDQMNSMLNSMGLEAEVTVTEKDIVSRKPVTRTQMSNIQTNEEGQIESYDMTTSIVDYTDVPEKIQVAQIATNGQDPGQPTVKFIGSGSVSPTSKGKSSGGGGKKDSTKKKSDEIERYHTVNKEIESIESKMSRASSAKDNAFGKNKIPYINKEIDALNELIEKHQEYKAEIEKNLKIDEANISQYGFIDANADGILDNWEAVMERELEAFNKAAQAYDKGGSETAFEAATKRYEDFKAFVKQYEETQKLKEEALAREEELKRERISKQLEKITTEVDFEIEINQRDLDKLDYIVDKLGRNLHTAIEQIDALGQQIGKYDNQSQFYRQGIANIKATAAAEGRALTDEEQRKIWEYEDALLDINGALLDIVETVEAKILEEFDEFNSKIDDNISRFDTYNSMLDHYNNIIKLSGRQTKDSMLMMELSAQKTETALQKLNATRDKYLAQKSVQDDVASKLAEAQKSGNEADIKYWQEQYDEITKAVEESHDEMLASWEETLEAAGSQFDLAIETTIQTLKDSISEFGLDNLADRYSKGQEEQERYLSNLDKEYELNKLNREISGKIDDTDNIRAKQKLLELQDEINKKLASGEEMSRYDLEHLQKKYELELAKIALEEAQNAKSTVRLTKDSEGNFGYVYSADQDAIDDAQQNYEDKLYDIKKASEEYLDEMSEKIIQNQQEMAEALEAVDKGKFENQKEYEAELDRIKEYYMGRDKYYRGEMQKAMDELGVTYQETLLGQLEGSASLEEAQAKLETSTNEATDKMGQAWKDWHDNVDGAMTEAGTSSATFTEDIKTDAEEIGTATEDLADVIDEQTEDMVDYMGRLVKAIADFRDEYLALVDEISTKNEATVGIGFDKDTDYSALMNEYLNNGGKTTDKAFKDLLNQRNAKVEWLKSEGYGESYWGTSGEDTLKKYQELEAGGGSAEDREWFTKDYMSDEELAQTFEKLEIPLGALEQTTNDIKTATGEIKTSTDTVGSKVDLTKDALNTANTAISTKTAETGKIISDKLGVTEATLKTAIEETDKSLNAILGEIKIAVETVGTNTETLSNDIDNAADTIVSGVGGVIDDIQSSVDGLDRRVSNIERSELEGFDTGGYTGSWGPEGKMAILHEKEIVLNQNDTSNLLNTMGIMRDIINMIDAQASMASLFNLSASSGVTTGNETLEQNVTIHAEFPNATNHSEIEEAFNNLVNRASQYANRK